jgi:predicted lipid-binding transport protein (Tim44 family)
MHNPLSSASSAKDKLILVDLDDLALAMHADATGMTDEEYATAQAELDQRKARKQPPLRPTKFGAFIAGLLAGALLLGLTIFVVSVSGAFAGVALIIGVALMAGVIMANMGDDQ